MTRAPRTPSLAISSDPGTDARARINTGPDTSAPTDFSSRLSSWWINGISGGTASIVSLRSMPPSQSRRRRTQSARVNLKSTRADWVRLLLLWLGGIDLRLTMLAVPPLIPLIHHELNLDEKSVGALVSGPVLILALASVPGSLLIAKLGVRGALVIGLGSVALFGAGAGERYRDRCGCTVPHAWLSASAAMVARLASGPGDPHRPGHGHGVS